VNAKRIYCNIEDKSEFAVIYAEKHEVDRALASCTGHRADGIALDAVHQSLGLPTVITK